jgi:hypothetical protein
MHLRGGTNCGSASAHWPESTPEARGGGVQAQHCSQPCLVQGDTYRVREHCRVLHRTWLPSLPGLRAPSRWISHGYRGQQSRLPYFGWRSGWLRLVVNLRPLVFLSPLSSPHIHPFAHPSIHSSTPFTHPPPRSLLPPIECTRTPAPSMTRLLLILPTQARCSFMVVSTENVSRLAQLVSDNLGPGD